MAGPDDGLQIEQIGGRLGAFRRGRDARLMERPG